MSRRLISEEVRSRVCELWNAGKTGGEIGSELGITKNSVVGIVDRLRRSGVEVRIRGTGTFKVKKPRPLVRKPQNDTARPKNVPGVPTDILGLTFRSCRFIVESGNELTTKYCNKRIYQKSFCREHHDLCYVPVKGKRASVGKFRR